MNIEDNIEKAMRVSAWSFKREDPQKIFKPLEKIVPKKWRDGFMFMGLYSYAVKAPNGQVWNIGNIHDYKHGITRRYLHISPSGACYCNAGRYNGEILLKKCSVKKALDMVYEDLKKLGATKATKYDEGYRLDRDQALAREGFVVCGISPGKISKTRKEFRIEEEIW